MGLSDIDRAFRKNWSRLIRKVYEVDPLICPKCQGRMRVVAFIENPDLIRKILKHLNLWDLKRPPRPVAHAPPSEVSPTYDEPLAPSADDYIIDPVFPLDPYL